MSDGLDDSDLLEFGPALPPQPYPGLRPFTQAEAAIFFGRESMTQDVVSRLVVRQLVAVHGDSGCGKSSLIAAGVMPFLKGDQARAGGTWTTAIMRPQDNPLGNLARALAGPEGEANPLKMLDIRRLLNRGVDAPAAVASHLGCSETNNVCILFDQFEELFEHARRGGGDAALVTAFLVGLAANRPKGLNAVLTMRSDYLGSCAQYQGFAEVVNDTQYLLPRMERPALLRAIREPAELFGGRIDPDLASRLIADAGAGQDQLPLIQHGLMLMWRRREKAGEAPRLAMQDYAAGGSLADQLSRHADEIMAEAMTSPGEEKVVEAIFRALTDRNSEGLAIRRRQPLAGLVELSGAPRETVTRILDRFRADDASFVRPFGAAPLSDEDEIDISHEAFIRNWRRIAEPATGWMDREANDGLQWTSLRLAADEFRRNPDAQLSTAAALERERWLKTRTAPWSERYGGQWTEVSALVEASSETARRAIRRRRRVFGGAIAAAAILAVVAAFAGWQTIEARKSAREAREAKLLADKNAQDAHEATEKAEKATEIAVQKAREATVNLSLSLWQVSKGVTSDGLPVEAVKLMLAAWPRSDEDQEMRRPKILETLRLALPDLRERKRFDQGKAVLYSARWSPDRKFIVTASADRIVRILDVGSGKTVRELTHDDLVSTAAWSPDGTRIVSASSDKTARIWEATGSAAPIVLTHDGAVNSAAFSPDGALVVTTSFDKSLRIWNAKDGSQLRRIDGAASYTDAMFSPDGTRIAATTNNGNGFIYDASSGEQVCLLRAHGTNMQWVDYSPDGARVVTASTDMTARIWDASTCTALLNLIGHQSAVNTAMFSPDGARIVTASNDRTVRIWDAHTAAAVDAGTGRTDNSGGSAAPSGAGSLTASGLTPSRGELLSIKGQEKGVTMASFGGDADTVLTAGGDGTARIWTASMGKERKAFVGHKTSVWSAAFSRDGTHIASIANDPSLRVWDAASGKEILRLDEPAYFWSAQFSPDGKSILTASDKDTMARLWDLKTKKELMKFVGHTSFVPSAAFSPDGTLIATASRDGTARLWSVADGTEKARFAAPEPSPMNSVAFSPDGTRIVTTSDDRKTRIWTLDAADKPPLLLGENDTAGGHTATVWSAAFSPDGSRVVTASADATAIVWDSRSGSRLFTLTGHKDVVYQAVYSSDGTRIATASADGTVRIWDAASGAELDLIVRQGVWFTSVAFSADGKSLLTASSDGVPRLWDISALEAGDAFQVACARLGANTDLSDIQTRYDLPAGIRAICGGSPPLPIAGP